MPGTYTLKKAILEFCGIQPVRLTTLGPIRSTSDIQRKKWLEEVKRKGKKGL
jgi:putative NADPH-quinone reductase